MSNDKKPQKPEPKPQRITESVPPRRDDGKSRTGSTTRIVNDVERPKPPPKK